MKRVTLSDVAAHAGVSKTAVSQVVRDSGRISDETRARVHRSMHELGYVYHRAAATLRTQRSSVVGLVVTDITNPYFAAMAVGLEQRLSSAGYVPLLANSFDDQEHFDEVVRGFAEHPVDALVVVPVAGGAPLEGIDGFGGPVLAVTRQPGSQLPFLGTDDTSAGTLLARHLLDVHGRRRIAYLGGPAPAGPRRARLRAVERSVAETGGAAMVFDASGGAGIEMNLQLARRFAAAEVDCDAVVCHTDVLALAVLHELASAGRRVPDEVSVAAFDGLDEGALFSPPLTSVSFHPSDLGRAAADWVLASIAGEPAEQVRVLDPELIVRRSCGC